MSVVTSIAAVGMKACIERLAASAKRVAQDPHANLAAERTRQTINAVEFEDHLAVLKTASTNAKSITDILV